MENHFHQPVISALQVISPYAYRNHTGNSLSDMRSNRNGPTASIRQVSSSSGLFQSYGSTVRHADWIDNLSPTQQRLARSLNQLIHVPINAIPPQVNLASSEFQALQTIAKPPMTTTPAPASHRHVRAITSRADHDVYQPMTLTTSPGMTEKEPPALLPTVSPSISGTSTSGSDAIANRHIPNHIISMLQDKKYSTRFQHRLDDLFRTAEISAEVKAAATAEQRNILLLIRCIELSITAVGAHAKTMGFDSDYHFFHIALKDFWNIAQRLSDSPSKSMIDHYQKRLQREKWQAHTTVIGRVENPEDSTANIVTDYINFDYVEWSRHGISHDTEIMLHLPHTARRFSLEQILHKEHLPFIAEHTMFCHFQFDNSGLPDDDLVDFMRIADTEQFEIFKRASPAFLPDGYYQIDATRLLQAHLQQIPHTPLRFQKLEKIQEIIDINAIPLSSRPSRHRDKRELNIALTNLALEQGRYDLLGYSAIVYANSLLSGPGSRTFKELKDEDIVYADYIYSYEDDDGRTRYDTTTLAEFLSQGVGSVFIDISLRKNVQILWPEEFDQRLISYLLKSIEMVNNFSRNLLIARDIADIRNDLKMEMPAFSIRLQRKFSEICLQADLHDASMTDLFTFTYQAHTYNPEMQAALQYRYPPRKMQFSAGQILLGAQRKWRSRNHNYNTEILTHSPPHLPAGKISAYVKALQDFPTQATLTQGLEQLKQHPFLKDHYQKYISLLNSRAQKKNTWRYEFSETPLMAIYLHAPPDPKTNATSSARHPLPRQLHFSLSLATPMTVLSIPSGTLHRFKSLNDMQQQLRENPTLWQHFRNHFPVDYGGDMDSLILIRRPPDGTLYERLIDWEIDNIDKIIESHTEASAFEILERLSDVSFILALPAMALGPASAILVDTLLSIGPKMIQAASCDTRQEQNQLIKDIITELSVSVFSGIASEMLGRGLAVSLRKLLKHPSIKMTTSLGTLESSDSIFRSLEPHNWFHCRSSGLSAKKSALCWFSKKTDHSSLSKPPTVLADIRFMEPFRKVPIHVSTSLPSSMSNYLHEMLNSREITAMLINPAGRCMDVVAPVTRFLLAQDRNMKISYRAILIWDKLLDAYIPTPLNHFVVLFEKQGQRFVVDLTAGQFANRGMPMLNKALLLPEPAWVKAYQSASTSKLMKYKDFSEWLTAKNYFGDISVLHEGTSYLEGAILLSVPRKLENSITRYI
jgi:hypothetical protein